MILVDSKEQNIISLPEKDLTLTPTTTEKKTIEQEEVEENSLLKRCINVAGEVLQWTNSFGATGTTAASIASLVVFLQGSCTETKVPYIVTIAFAGVYNVIAVAKDFYDMKKKGWDESKALKKEIERDLLEKTRHEELSQLLLETLASVHRYEKKRDNESFVKCINSVKQLPVTKNQPDIRDKWLSTIIQLSKDEEDLKATYNEIHLLGEKIEKIKLNLAEINKNQTISENQNSSRPTEGAGYANGSSNLQNSFVDDLEKYQREWRAMEDKVGFEVNFIERDGFYYYKDGSVVNSDETIVINIPQEKQVI